MQKITLAFLLVTLYNNSLQSAQDQVDEIDQEIDQELIKPLDELLNKDNNYDPSLDGQFIKKISEDQNPIHTYGSNISTSVLKARIKSFKTWKFRDNKFKIRVSNNNLPFNNDVNQKICDNLENTVSLIQNSNTMHNKFIIATLWKLNDNNLTLKKSVIQSSQNESDEITVTYLTQVKE